MKKLLKELQLLFGNAPTPASFDAKLLTFKEPAREEYRLKLCRLAFGYYDSLPGPFRKFVDKYLKHDRELYVDFLLHHTPLGKLRYTLHNPDLFTLMFCVLEKAGSHGRPKYHQMASGLLLAFHYPYKLETLDNYLCHIRPDADDLRELLFLMGKIKVKGD
ncbi:MAG: hypothetical protein ACK5N4_16365 [Parabacteroides gordonii]|uniref:hypothetical protein n=1 Tax=Parabacteroides gordonii TaxID=574930 RepID=UPI003A84924B